jgi:Holliday junction resolvasome RuvABC ATP-dependent DNA helicase subunit
LIGAKGQGKTMIAREVARYLPVAGTNRPRPFVEVNCSSIHSVSSFFSHVYQNHIQNKEVTVLFDEASELPKVVSMAFLTIFNSSLEGQTTFFHEGEEYDFNFRRQSFLFATTEPQRMFHALLNRLERVDLEEYGFEELGRIVSRGCPEVTIDPGLTEQIATFSRANGRTAFQLGQKIDMFCKVNKIRKFGGKGWDELCGILDIKPLGINQTELRVMQYLGLQHETSLTALSSKMGMTKEAIQRDAELFLLKNGLMEVRQRGRGLTSKGFSFLKTINA